MSFSINTNVASLQAQNYLRISSEFQGKTINRVTSGMRIIQSGDDAAGLAIANGLRSDQAVLMQGVRNANDGLSQLQIIDGGVNNISQLLERARPIEQLRNIVYAAVDDLPLAQAVIGVADTLHQDCLIGT